MHTELPHEVRNKEKQLIGSTKFQSIKGEHKGASRFNVLNLVLEKIMKIVVHNAVRHGELNSTNCIHKLSIESGIDFFPPFNTYQYSKFEYTTLVFTKKSTLNSTINNT